MRVYFDYNATTPLAPEAAEATARALRDQFGNASSVHHFGQQAKAAIDEARSAVAALLNADPSELVFTSGGTESDNFAIRGAAEALDPIGRRHLIAGAIEHEAVLNTLKALARRGWRTTLLPVDQSGIVSPDRLREIITDDTALVSVMHANNEIGTIQPVAELAAIAHERGALMHTDAVQSTGKIPVDVRALGVDLLSLSAHKFSGPKGAGALWIKRGTRLQPILTGGRHERSRRAGTENVPALVGLGVAACRTHLPGAFGVEDERGGGARRGSPRSAGGAHLAGRWRDGRQRHPLVARPQHDQHQFRSRRGREPVDRARSRRRRGVDRFSLLVGDARTVTCPPRDGLFGAPRTELIAVQLGNVLDRRGSRPRRLAAALDCREAAGSDPENGVSLECNHEITKTRRHHEERSKIVCFVPSCFRVFVIVLGFLNNAHRCRHVGRRGLVGGGGPAR